MANHKSAKKRHRQSLVRAARNRSMKTRIKNVVKDLNEAIAQNNKEEALVLLPKAVSVLGKAASKSTIHWKKMARKTARLTRAVNALSS